MHRKSPVSQRYRADGSVFRQKGPMHNSSLIQTILSVPESHRIGCKKQFADCTAGGESHPAPKNFCSDGFYYCAGELSSMLQINPQQGNKYRREQRMHCRT